ncbi:MAG: cytochrome c biogenesis protein CcsA [Longimicrobiales bacterium]
MSSGQSENTAASPRWLPPFGWFTLLFVSVSQAFALLTSPPDRDMGELQKIMYVHVPAAWMAFLAFAVVGYYSVRYLATRKPAHDLLAFAAAEVGTVFTALTIALGSIWGRPTWGVWWIWDPRLTTTAILLLIFAGYLALRAFTDDEERRARWSAAVGILGALNVPIVYMSVKWWRTIHQMQSTPSSMDTVYWRGLLLNAVAFLALFVFLVASRYYLARLERNLESRAEEQALMGGAVHV